MDNKLTLRIIIDVVITLCAILGLWYVALPLGLVAAWLFPYYVELVAVGFVYDAIFGMGRGLGLFGYAGVIAGAVLLAVVSFLRFVIRR
ncbi:MAG: hypothetical protein ABSF56_03100 [Minisyncoccia bacterium]|jgi:hypothetical protein